jgi:hypothetical protein
MIASRNRHYHSALTGFKITLLNDENTRPLIQTRRKPFFKNIRVFAYIVSMKTTLAAHRRGSDAFRTLCARRANSADKLADNVHRCYFEWQHEQFSP